MIDAFKGDLIGIELRDLTECAPCVWYSRVDKSRFGKNQSYKVLTPDR